MTTRLKGEGLKLFIRRINFNPMSLFNIIG